MVPVQTFSILVFSDEIRTGNTLRSRSSGRIGVIVSPSIENGLARVKNERADVVLLNLRMPGLDTDGAVQQVRASLGNVPVIGFTPKDGPGSGEDEVQSNIDELSQFLDSQPFHGKLVSPTLGPTAPQDSDFYLPQKKRMPSVYWPKLPLQVEESLPVEVLAMMLHNHEVMAAAESAAASTGGTVVASAETIQTPPSAVKSMTPTGHGTSNGTSPVSQNGGGSFNGKSTANNGSANISAPASEPSNSTFLRDEAAMLEQANEFDVVDANGRRLSGRVRRLSSNFLVGEVIAQAKFQAEDWNGCSLAVRFGQHIVYRGPARLLKLVNTGNSMICEWALQGQWERPVSESHGKQTTAQVFSPFLDRIRILGRISDVFKAVVADVATVLGEAKQALDRVEVTIQPIGDEAPIEAIRRQLPDLQKALFPVLDDVFYRFERACAAVPSDLDAQHHLLVRQYLHPYLLTSPFIEHIYSKPLGYAGDYGALQRLLGDPFDGPTLFARLINAWLVLTPAGEAYRHRIHVLTQALHHQAAACQRQGRSLRVLSLGCGAATEIARFVATDDLSEGAEFTLVDFNETTLNEADLQVRQAAETSWRQVRHKTVNRNIQNLVADDARMQRKHNESEGEVVRAGGYDLVHCTGLFDYFSDRVCERLMQLLYRVLAPGGTLVVCNFTPDNTIQHFMRLALDWKLIHRTAQQLRMLAPREVSGENCRVSLSPGGVEAYLHITKPLQSPPDALT